MFRRSIFLGKSIFFEKFYFFSKNQRFFSWFKSSRNGQVKCTQNTAFFATKIEGQTVEKNQFSSKFFSQNDLSENRSGMSLDMNL